MSSAGKMLSEEKPTRTAQHKHFLWVLGCRSFLSPDPRVRVTEVSSDSVEVTQAVDPGCVGLHVKDTSL